MRRPRLAVGLEPAERRDVDREAGVAIGERWRSAAAPAAWSGTKHGHLLAVLTRLERGAYGDLGLAVADVAADQPVHRHDLLHVALDVLDRGQLVGRLDEGERVLELALPGRVG